MLKRSFAEFHAQKNLPEKEKLLLQMLRQPTRTIEWDTETLTDFYLIDTMDTNTCRNHKFCLEYKTQEVKFHGTTTAVAQ